VFEDNIQDAITALFGTATGSTQLPNDQETETSPEPQIPSETGNAETDLANAISDMQKAVADGKKALANGDFTAYGKAQKELEDALERALDAQKRLNSTNPIEITPANFVR
jgi:uncharacterized membrane protein (UPF0182 family)